MAGQRMIGATEHQSNRRSVVLTLGVCLWTLLIVMREPATPISGRAAHVNPSLQGFQMRGFQLTSQGGNRPDVHLSGASLTLSQAPLLGPFRLGFAYAIVIRDLTVEIFSHTALHGSEKIAPAQAAADIQALDTSPHFQTDSRRSASASQIPTIQTTARPSNSHQLSSLEHIWALLAQSLNSTLLSLVTQQGKPAITSAEIHLLKIVQYQRGNAIVMFEAETCHLNRKSKIICNNGAIFQHGQRKSFRRWIYQH